MTCGMLWEVIRPEGRRGKDSLMWRHVLRRCPEDLSKRWRLNAGQISYRIPAPSLESFLNGKQPLIRLADSQLPRPCVHNRLQRWEAIGRTLLVVLCLLLLQGFSQRG